MNGRTYRYAVRATNAAGGGPLSAEVETTPIAQPPGAPARLTASRGDRAVSLRWEPGAYAESHRVLRAGLTDGDFAVVATGVAGETWTDTSVANGIGYTYRVEAANEAGVSDPSDRVTVVPGCTLTHHLGPDGAVIEAERYSASSGEYAPLDDLTRFGGRAAAVPRGSQYKNNPALWGRYDLEVAQAGRYHLAILGYGETGSNDSVTIAVDNATPFSVNLGTGVWSYRQSPIGIDLERGFHTVLVKAREDGAQVDRFVLHPAADIPDEVRFAPVATQPAHPECGSGAAAPAAPAPVGVVSAKAEGDGVRLIWSGSGLAESYGVLRDGVPVVAGLTSTTWVDGVRGTRYQVVASNAVGDAPPSAPVSAG